MLRNLLGLVLAGVRWDQISLLLGAALGGGGFFSVIITSRSTNRIEAAKQVATKSQNELDAQRVKLEGWDGLVASLQAEITRKDQTIKERDATIERLQVIIRTGKDDAADVTRTAKDATATRARATRARKERDK